MAKPHKSAHGKEYMDMPSMNPMKPDESRTAPDSKDYREPAAEFPAQGANDLGELWQERSDGPQFSAQLTDEAGENNDNAEQTGGNGPRIDDLGYSDLSDKQELGKADLPAIDKLARTDQPLFDRSLDNRNPDEPEPDPHHPDAKRVGKDKLSGEDLRAYDVSVDGPGTSDLH